MTKNYMKMLNKYDLKECLKWYFKNYKTSF